MHASYLYRWSDMRLRRHRGQWGETTDRFSLFSKCQMETLKSTHRKSMGFLRFQMFVILTIHWFHSTNWTSRKTAQLEPSYEYLKRRRGVSKRTFWTANQLKRSWSNPLVTLSPKHTNTIVWYCSARYMLGNGVTQASLKSAECNAFFKASCICISWSLAPGNEIFLMKFRESECE